MRQGCGLHGNQYGSAHFGLHSRASLCALAICAGVNLEAARSRLCTEHYARLFRIIEEYRLPVTIWDCNWNAHMTLDECPKRDMP